MAFRILGDQAEAENVAQDVFLSCWRSAGSYDVARGSTRARLLAMTHNRAIDVLRARARRPVFSLDGQRAITSQDDPVRDTITNIDVGEAGSGLAGLPPEQRQVIELAYFNGLSHTEIAARLAIPVGTIKGRIRLGLERLRTALIPAKAAL